jgi:Glycosyl hydrolases family 43
MASRITQVRRSIEGLSLVLLSLCIVASGSVSGASEPSTGPLKTPIQPNARAGELVLPPGNAATLGPLSRNPSTADGVHLSVVTSLLDDTPVFNGDFADPSALPTTDSIYVYSSSTVTTPYAAGAHIPVIELPAASGFEGTYLGDALPVLPSWTVPGFQWRPSVWAQSDGTYVLYYATPAVDPLDCVYNPHTAGCVQTATRSSSAMCISRATSSSPSGPFVDDSTSAFICPTAQGGAIDPSVFVASDGTPWLLWKTDGDCCGLPTAIYSQQLAADGLSVAGPPHRLIGASQAWEGNLVEGPSMVESGGTYWLFYSANLWGTPDYGIGLARCASVTGPCTKPLGHAWLSSSTSGQHAPGPGGEEFFQIGGVIWMVHHALAPGQTGNLAQRRLYVDLVAFPPGRLPRLAQGAPAAALAEAALYEEAVLPSRPSQAYLFLLHQVGRHWPHVHDAAAVADATASCKDLAQHQSGPQVEGSLEKRSLTEFQSDLVEIYSAKYICPQYEQRAETNLRSSILGAG